MNEPVPVPVPRFFQPVTLLAGVVLGFIGLAWAGRAVTARDWHRDFVRFHPMIAPESMYQPTVGEMRAIVRSHCRKDQILVIVGGNSILQGVGQPVEKLWSRRLQELLGDRFAVVNLAFRGSSPTDAGALCAESLRDEYPRQIYLANVPPLVAASPAGGLDYRFMQFDALYKGWLLDQPSRNAVIADYLAHPEVYPPARELSYGGRLDAWLRFRDFWNWWSATRFFTFPTSMVPDLRDAFQARNDFKDLEPDYEAEPAHLRFTEKFLATEMLITRNATSRFYQLDGTGRWRLTDWAERYFRDDCVKAFPETLRKRTLIVLSPNCPYYTDRLTAGEKARDELSFKDSIRIWKELGYEAMAYGAGYTIEDFGDRTHLTGQGGRKLAREVAPQILQIAGKLGYLPPGPP